MHFTLARHFFQYNIIASESIYIVTLKRNICKIQFNYLNNSTIDLKHLQGVMYVNALIIQKIKNNNSSNALAI